jgi:hypothetical protein
MSGRLYEIPDGCICLGDGLYGMPCDAKDHVRYFCQCACGCASQLSEAELQWTAKNRTDRRAFYCGKCYREMA